MLHTENVSVKRIRITMNLCRRDTGEHNYSTTNDSYVLLWERNRFYWAENWMLGIVSSHDQTVCIFHHFHIQDGR